MRSAKRVTILSGLFGLVVLLTGTGFGGAVGTAFTYQGALMDANRPADGLYDLQFRLYDHPDPNIGLQVSEAVTIDSLDVIEGYFTVELDFGAEAFDGRPLWLELAVRAGELEDPNAFTILLPRQRLTPAPYAIHAETAERIAGRDSSAMPYVSPYDPATVYPGFNLSDLTSRFGNVGLMAYLPGSTLIYDTGTKVGIGTVDPLSKLHVYDGNLRVSQTSLNSYILCDAGANRAPVLELQENSQRKWTIWNEPGTDQLRFNDSSGTRMVLTPSRGRLGIGTVSPRSRLHVYGGNAEVSNPSQNAYVVCNAGSGNAAVLELQEASSRRWTLWNEPGTDQLRINDATGTRLVIVPSTGNVGIGTVSPAAKLHVAGTTRTQVLEITGGSDLAEPFELTDAEKAEPGMVVCIDPDHTGKLHLSGKPYDRTVAGVISGANGIKAGLTMKQQDTPADGNHPVALSGRVYCLCDASNGPINPGDLLTTSATPGHAMKVTDHAAAAGAILGKAMSRLETGRGLVLVLVSLQ